MLYPDRWGGRAGRLTLDILVLLWTAAWALAGWAMYSLVMMLEVLADAITSTGRTFESWIEAFRNASPQGIPGISSALGNLANQLQRSGADVLIQNGAAAHDRIQQLAIATGVFVGLMPILIVTGGYLLWRVRDVREMSAAAAFVRAAQRSGRVEQARAVLAHRAVATLPFRQLMGASADPIGDLEEGRHDALAAAMLRRAGLRPGRAVSGAPNIPPTERPAVR
jgi:hypothetical protein